MAVKNSRRSTAGQSSIEFGESAIRVAAYYIWEKEGRVEGDDLRHWYLAVAELSSSPRFPQAASTVIRLASRKKTEAGSSKSK
jgi:hypothetical protein